VRRAELTPTRRAVGGAQSEAEGRHAKILMSGSGGQQSAAGS
jgi:hypothetical protein